MKNLEKYLGPLAVVAVLVIAIIVAWGQSNRPIYVNVSGVSSDSSTFGSGTRFPNGLSADSTSPSAGEVRGTTLTITSTGAFTGALTLGTATTTAASQGTPAFFTFGGIDFAYVQQAMASATNVPCAIPNPFGSATSSILSFVAQITTGTSTAATIDVATSTSATASSSPALIWKHSIASGVQDTIIWSPSSTSTPTGTTVLAVTDAANGVSPYYLGPDEYLNFIAGNNGIGGFTWTGTCSALFMKP